MTSTNPISPQRPRSGYLLVELKRFGLCRALLQWWLLVAVAISVAAAFLVPTGQYNSLAILLPLHITMLGFSMTVFGFVILGGKDDFFEPLMVSRADGLDLLRNMVLILFWPLPAHFLAAAVCFLRLIIPAIGHIEGLNITWRILYGFITLYSFVVSFFAARYLFRLAIIRLIWRKGKTNGANNEATTDDSSSG